MARVQLGDGSTINDEVTYLTGIGADGRVAAKSFGTWQANQTPDTRNAANGDGFYDNQFAAISKWGGDNTTAKTNTAFTTSAGTSGGNVTYSFDAGSNWTGTEQADLASALNLWSAVANISFSQSSDATNANLIFSRNTNNSAAAQSFSNFSNIGSDQISRTQSATITIDTRDPSAGGVGFGGPGDFTNNGGFGVLTALHEVGHTLGLGHGGPYDGANPTSTQDNQYDNIAYSIMSYFRDPAPGNASSSQYPFPTNISYNGGVPTTWQPLDIDAVQRIYGAQTNGPLNTAQTFGYNTTVGGSLGKYFNFSTLPKPIVTIYDTAASGNVLDLSGTSLASTVNLNPGTYSSSNGLTNNIAIYKNTYIEKLNCGAGDDTCTVNVGKNNQIDGGTGTNKAVFAGDRSEYVISGANNVVTVTRTNSADTAARPNNVVTTLTNFQTAQFANQTDVVCFASGTLIRTSRGDVAVEDLGIGDVAVTSSGAHRPIRWIGHRTLACTGHRERAAILPVRIAAHTFGPDRPARDLFVSPAHAICVDLMGEVLIPACRLINGTTITQVEVEAVTYWHVELDGHDILLAEGLPAESYLDIGNRAFFSESDVVAVAATPDGDHAARKPADFCRPFHEDGPVVDFVRARLEARARDLGWHQVEEPFADLHILADGAVIRPDTHGLTARFVLPASARDVRLVSATSVPAHVLPGSSDDRRLGVSLSALTLDDGLTGSRAIALDDVRLAQGFHVVDQDGAAAWRWTDGSAVLPAELWDGCRGTVFLRIQLSAAALPRWIGPHETADVIGLDPVRRSA